METFERAGIYSLANDAVLDWAIPFFESLRLHDPDRPLVVIPFDDNITELRRLATRYSFDILSGETLEELDTLGACLWPEQPASHHRFRKFAAFWGPFETFLFLDSDVLVLDELDYLFGVFAGASSDLLYADADLDYVYREGQLRRRMRGLYQAPGFNAGAFLSSRLALTPGDVRAFTLELIECRDQLGTNGDQPAINYCLDRAGLEATRFSEADHAIAFSCWAGEPGVATSAYCESHVDGEGRWVPFLHWAGSSASLSMPYRDLFMRFQREDGGPPATCSLTRVAKNAYGLGLTAAQQLEAGTVVAEWAGPIVPYDQVPDRESSYVLDLGEHRFMIPSTEARYINHACDPNCRLDSDLRVRTTKFVTAGEELTYDYVGITKDEFAQGRVWDERWTFDCQCGSPGCLGRIDGYVVSGD